MTDRHKTPRRQVALPEDVIERIEKLQQEMEEKIGLRNVTKIQAIDMALDTAESWIIHNPVARNRALLKDFKKALADGDINATLDEHMQTNSGGKI